MVIDSSYVDSNFIYQFTKKFKAYCSKLPFFVSFHISREKCQLVNEDSTETHDYVFDLDKTVAESIHDIRIWMLKYWHPRLYEPIDAEVPSSSEIANDLRNGKNVEEIKLRGKSIKTVWIIDKVIITKDTLLLFQDNEYDFSWVFKLNMPSSIFLKNVRGKWDNETAWDMFVKKSEFQYKSPMKLSINKVNADEVQQSSY